MHYKRGFTLIELLVVIAIVGIISGFIVVSMSGATGVAKDAKRKASIDTIRRALLMYKVQNGNYPTEATQCNIGSNCSNLATALVPTYIPALPTDPNSGSYYTYVSATGVDFTVGATLSNETGYSYTASTGFSGGVVAPSYSSTCAAASNANVTCTPGAISSTEEYCRCVLTGTTTGTVSWTAPNQVTQVQYLIVAGGGGGGGDGYGGSGAGAGGGGAGGLLAATGYAVTAGSSYTITVGAGGVGGAGTGSYNYGSNGSNSVFSTFTVIGGGAGAAGVGAGNVGGSGGGSGYSGAGGLGTSGQGYSGGGASTNTPYAGAGGGGAGGSGGAPANNSTGGVGGAGLVSSITNSSITYAAGGKGANGWNVGAGADGTASTGSGGAGAGGGAGGKGGSGVVIIRYTHP